MKKPNFPVDQNQQEQPNAPEQLDSIMRRSSSTSAGTDLREFLYLI